MSRYGGCPFSGTLPHEGNRGEPTVRTWLGKPVSASMPLMTIGSSSGRLERWLVPGCVHTRTTPPGLLAIALMALYGDPLEHIRAGRPTEAVDGMGELSRLPEVWHYIPSRRLISKSHPVRRGLRTSVQTSSETDSGQHDLRKRCLVRPVRSIVR
jgi:hypothetical protein